MKGTVLPASSSATAASTCRRGRPAGRASLSPSLATGPPPAAPPPKRGTSAVLLRGSPAPRRLTAPLAAPPPMSDTSAVVMDVSSPPRRLAAPFAPGSRHRQPHAVLRRVPQQHAVAVGHRLEPGGRRRGLDALQLLIARQHHGKPAQPHGAFRR